MATATLPPSATRYKRLSLVAAERAAREAAKVRGRGTPAVSAVLVQHQMTQAILAEQATALMLADQGAEVAAAAPLLAAGFTTSTESLGQMLEQVDTDFAFARLIASLTQDAGRAAQSVAVAARPRTGWVRVLTPPSCSRCAVLAGRVYSYSSGFLRHPADDCTTIPVREGDTTHVPDVEGMARRGLISDLSKADTQALRDGADLGQVVNVRRSAAGLRESGSVLYRRGRMTPEAIYRSTSDREEALSLLASNGYLAA